MTRFVQMAVVSPLVIWASYLQEKKNIDLLFGKLLDSLELILSVVEDSQDLLLNPLQLPEQQLGGHLRQDQGDSYADCMCSELFARSAGLRDCSRKTAVEYIGLADIDALASTPKC